MKERKKRGKKSKKRKSDDLADEIVDRSKGPTWVQCNLCQKVSKSPPGNDEVILEQSQVLSMFETSHTFIS